jgi:hypothetical protein
MGESKLHLGRCECGNRAKVSETTAGHATRYYCGVHDPARRRASHAALLAQIARDREVAKARDAVVKAAKAWESPGPHCGTAPDPDADLREAVKRLRVAEARLEEVSHADR